MRIAGDKLPRARGSDTAEFLPEMETLDMTSWELVY